MRIVIIGLTEQGLLRQHGIQQDCVARLDSLQELPINSYDAVFVCSSDEQKYNVIRYALANKKHVLVETPLLFLQEQQLEELEHLASSNRVVCYAAASYRFEPYFIRAKQLLDSGTLGQIYHISFYYGDNTAKSVLNDLGAPILDTLDYWFGSKIRTDNFSIVSKKNFEGLTPDHVVVADFSSKFNLQIELTSLSWRNQFSCDLVGENGSLHISSLCKWGTSSLLLVQRSEIGTVALEDNETIVQLDPRLDAEHDYFKQLCAAPRPQVDLSVAQWVSNEINRLNSEELLIA